MQSLAMCAICLLAIAAGLGAYEALAVWTGAKARLDAPAWMRQPAQDRPLCEGRARPRAGSGARRVWARAAAALDRFAPLSKQERERSRQRLRLAGIALEPET